MIVAYFYHQQNATDFWFSHFLELFGYLFLIYCPILTNELSFLRWVVIGYETIFEIALWHHRKKYFSNYFFNYFLKKILAIFFTISYRDELSLAMKQFLKLHFDVIETNNFHFFFDIFEKDSCNFFHHFTFTSYVRYVHNVQAM